MRGNEPALVSIIVTTCNGEKYLREQLDSIVGQTYRHLEIVICDDASTDDTANILREYAARDHRITPVFRKQNLGLHANLKSGLQMSTGQFIAISDQDDIWAIEKIERLLGIIGHAPLAYSDSALIDGTGASLGITVLRQIAAKGSDIATRPFNLISQNVVSGHAMLFRREILAAILPLPDSIIFDWHIAITASLYGSLVFYPEPLVQHRIHGNNHTNAKLAKDKDKIKQQNPINRQNDKLSRRRETDQALRINISRLVLQSQAISLHGRIAGYDTQTAEIIWQINQAWRDFDTTFINVRILFLFFRLGKRHPDTPFGSFRKAMKAAKGARWYRFAALFGAR